MDVSVMFEIFLSVLVFAPGVILLTAAMIIGVIMLAEKAGILDDDDREDTDDSDLKL